MKKFRQSKPPMVKEFYYPQTLAIRNDASDAVRLQKGWEVDSTIEVSHVVMEYSFFLITPEKLS